MVKAKKLLLLLAVCLIACAGTACFDKNNIKQYVQHYDYGGSVMKYVQGLDEYESIEYESVVNKPAVSIGPSEPLYRGVIVLKDDIAEAVWNKYEWEQADPEFEFVKIDSEILNNSTWYYSEEFEKDTIRYQKDEYIYFNGSEVVFCFRAD